MADDAMVSELSNEQTIYYSYMNEGAEQGILLTPVPGQPERYVTMEILKCKDKDSVTYDGHSVLYKKTIRMILTVEGVQEPVDFTVDDLRRQIEQSTEEEIRQGCLQLFEDYKNQNIDLLNITDTFQRTYPRESTENLLQKTQMDVDIDVRVEGGQNLNDTTKE